MDESLEHLCRAIYQIMRESISFLGVNSKGDVSLPTSDKDNDDDDDDDDDNTKNNNINYDNGSRDGFGVKVDFVD
ncbi:MAG: hypothetical protein Q9217_003619 [Psora testacea]